VGKEKYFYYILISLISKPTKMSEAIKKSEEKKNEISLSYENLFEILRREKYRQDIQKLPENFDSHLINYISEKKNEFKKNSTKFDLHNIAENSKSKNILDNIVRIIKDLYDRREKKILMLAINKARVKSNIIDTSNLTPDEKEFLNETVEVITKARKNILYNMLEGDTSKIKHPITKKEEDKLEESPKKNEDFQITKQNEESLLSIKFTEDVEKFVGEELEVYGPFKAEEESKLPTPIAELLIKKGKAIKS
jgi:DNA replication initiation complex subunit (GINS family)